MQCIPIVVSVLVALVASASATVDPQNNATLRYITNVDMSLANIIPEADIQTSVNNILKAKKPVKPIKKVIDGTPARLGEFPYQAGLIGQLPRFTVTCGGSLLTANRVVTAAHCWWDGKHQVEMFTVVLGSTSLRSGGVRMRTNKVIMNKKWDPRNTLSEHDIAMVYLPRAVKFSDTIQPIALPSGHALRDSFAGEAVYASGYGLSRNGNRKKTLNYVKLQVITNKECSLTYGYIPSSEICTWSDNFKNVCYGDSGSPLALFTNNEPILVGIASYIWKNCTAGDPSVFTRVTSHIRWIRAHLDMHIAGY